MSWTWLAQRVWKARQHHALKECSVFPLCHGVIVLLQAHWTICIEPLNIQIIDAVFLHKRGAAQLCCSVVRRIAVGTKRIHCEEVLFQPSGLWALRRNNITVDVERFRCADARFQIFSELICKCFQWIAEFKNPRIVLYRIVSVCSEVASRADGSATPIVKRLIGPGHLSIESLHSLLCSTAGQGHECTQWKDRPSSYGQLKGQTLYHTVEHVHSWSRKRGCAC